MTDQYAGLRALEWEEESEEKICAAASTFITDEYLQSLVKTSPSFHEEITSQLSGSPSFSANQSVHAIS